jgi:hypothetical protein
MEASGYPQKKNKKEMKNIEYTRVSIKFKIPLCITH